MLVLSRLLDESIIIGEGDDAIVVTVVDVKGDKVRLGVSALAEVPVHRAEVYRAIHGSLPYGVVVPVKAPKALKVESNYGRN